MILKLIGSAMVLISASILGIAYSREFSKRPQQLRALQGLLQLLENDISFLSSILSDAFERLYRCSSSEVSVFFMDAAKNLRSLSGMNASEAWEISVRNNMSKTSLSREDEQILISFGKMLGNSDLEGQLKNIRLAVSQLKLQEQKAEEQKRKNEAMYRSLGFLGGLAIVILLV